MASSTYVEAFHRRLRAWLREEVAVEEEFRSIMCRYRLELGEHMVKRPDMITEFERFVNAGCLEGSWSHLRVTVSVEVLVINNNPETISNVDSDTMISALRIFFVYLFVAGRAFSVVPSFGSTDFTNCFLGRYGHCGASGLMKSAYLYGIRNLVKGCSNMWLVLLLVEGLKFVLDVDYSPSNSASGCITGYNRITNLMDTSHIICAYNRGLGSLA
ncbi:hypothetical protein Tco_1359943 [Tanacetum coccineum]